MNADGVEGVGAPVGAPYHDEKLPYGGDAGLLLVHPLPMLRVAPPAIGRPSAPKRRLGRAPYAVAGAPPSRAALGHSDRERPPQPVRLWGPFALHAASSSGARRRS